MIFHIGWAVWLIYFLVLEGVALFNKTEGDTFSEHVWAWLKGKKQPEPHAQRTTNFMGEDHFVVVDPNIKTQGLNHNTWRTFAVGAFLLWLFFHLTFGWFAG